MEICAAIRAGFHGRTDEAWIPYFDLPAAQGMSVDAKLSVSTDQSDDMTRTDFGDLACITVTYHPDPEVLRYQLCALPCESSKVLVDNGSPETLLAELEALLADVANWEILRLGKNVGLAAATNIGADHISLAGKARLLLILDQDSEPCPDSVTQLMKAFDSLSSAGLPIGAVGPALLDPTTNHRHGFHVIDGLRWRRIDPDGGPPVRCDSLNGSGTLVDLALFQKLGGLEAALFIDHVDTEWSFRLAANGRQMYGVPAAQFIHRMGDSSMQVWLGRWTVWPIRSSLRHRYLFRNSMLLLRRSYAPCVWKLWVVPKLLLIVLIFAITGPNRGKQMLAMVRGLKDGIQNKKRQAVASWGS